MCFDCNIFCFRQTFEESIRASEQSSDSNGNSFVLKPHWHQMCQHTKPPIVLFFINVRNPFVCFKRLSLPTTVFFPMSCCQSNVAINLSLSKLLCHWLVRKQSFFKSRKCL